jgi:hypothetical protein
MKNTQTPQPNKNSGKPINRKSLPTILLVLMVIATALVCGAVLLNKQSSATNYAEESAKPFEDGLIAEGAVKKCSYGDGGYGTDNDEPWHNAYYELPGSRDKAIALVNSIATKNGYNLTHASPVNRGHLGAVADTFIDNWYFDNTNKTSPYQDLQSGQIELAFGVNNDGPHELSQISCQTKEPIAINSSATQSMISLEVRLPEFKR